MQQSQSLLRQRLLPDCQDTPGPALPGLASQSLLRQRLLPDAYERQAPLASEKSLNRFFVSDYFRTQLGRFVVDALDVSQSLLRQRLLPDGGSAGAQDAPGIVSIASSSAITSGRL